MEKLSLEELKTLDIGTRLFGYAALVHIHVMENSLKTSWKCDG